MPSPRSAAPLSPSARDPLALQQHVELRNQRADARVTAASHGSPGRADIPASAAVRSSAGDAPAARQCPAWPPRRARHPIRSSLQSGAAAAGWSSSSARRSVVRRNAASRARKPGSAVFMQTFRARRITMRKWSPALRSQASHPWNRRCGLTTRTGEGVSRTSSPGTAAAGTATARDTRAARNAARSPRGTRAAGSKTSR